MLLRQACWWRCCKCCGHCPQLCLVICGSVPSDSNKPLKPILLKPAGRATFTFSQLGISGTLQAQRWKEFTSNERVRTNTPHKTHTDSLSLCQIPQSSKGNQGQMREASERWQTACRRSWSYYKVPQQHSEEFASFIFICCPCQSLDEKNRYTTRYGEKKNGTHEQI